MLLVKSTHKKYLDFPIPLLTTILPPDIDPIVLLSSPRLLLFMLLTMISEGGHSPFSRHSLIVNHTNLLYQTKVITFPDNQRELKVIEPKKSSLEYATSYEPKDEIPEVELKELPPHLEYAFLEENNKLPVIISKDLSQEEKTSLI
ncbi:hypothetical protein Tco_0298398 [Tanacetum coccineum]